ncbi:IS21 family transposase [Candidatus Margulisiibacteriota bacterium]
MANRRKDMRNIKEMLRLSEAGVNKSQIAVITRSNRSTVRDYLVKLKAANICYQDCKGLSDQEVYQILYGDTPHIQRKTKHLPDFEVVHKELKGHKHMTLQLVWEEYIDKTPDGCSYGRFCHHYQKWLGRIDYSMRQTHYAGEKTFVDYAGDTVPITNQDTGEIRRAKIFVAVLGASNYTYAESTWTEGLSDWLSSMAHTFEFFGGITELVVPDNLKSAVQKACRYEPTINKAMRDFADHYGVAVLPARVRKPKDKSKVENGVLIVERWILAALRHHTFFSLTELNQHIYLLLEKLNNKPFKKLEGSRRTAFESLDQPVLGALPKESFQYVEWKEVRVGPDCHVDVDGHYYSVPCQYMGQKVNAGQSNNMVIISSGNIQIASHCRSYRKGKKTTVMAHMPKNHQEYGQWTPERMKSWAAQIGPYASEFVEKMVQQRPHPALAYRSILGTLRMSSRYGNDRLEAACRRNLELGGCAYQSVKSILEKGLDLQPVETMSRNLPKQHENIRGPESFKEQQTLMIGEGHVH